MTPALRRIPATTSGYQSPVGTQPSATVQEAPIAPTDKLRLMVQPPSLSPAGLPNTTPPQARESWERLVPGPQDPNRLAPLTPFQSDAIAAPPPPEQAQWGKHSAQPPAYIPEADSSLNGEALTLADVVASVYRAYPEIEQARLRGRLTSGEQTTALGAYDLKLEGYTLNQPVGFYKNYRQGIGLARQTWWGGYLSSGYRLGRGEIEPWYKERQTNTGGEFKLALVQPLLQGRAIDAYRVELFQANLRRQSVGPEIQENILYVSKDAADAYWSWVAAGVTLRAQLQLLRLAETRDGQLREMLKVGQEKVINIIVNDQLIAERRGKVVESEQKFWQASSKLSLYLRDENGQPLVPSPFWLPGGFADTNELPVASFDQDLFDAISRRPELTLLDLQIQEIQWDARLASNQMLPSVDFTIQGKQGLGDPLSSSSIDDKGPFQLEAGVIGDVPIQRRKARGKLTASNAKIDILNQKRRLQTDKIAVELQIAQTALMASSESIRQAKAALNASTTTLEAYRFAFEKGQLDLVFLNLVEPKVTENQIKLFEQEQKWYAALAAKQAALGLDPLEQAMMIPIEPPKPANDAGSPFQQLPPPLENPVPENVDAAR